MATTSFATFRDVQAVKVEALTPEAFAGVAFEEHRDEADIYDWAQDNPQACLRRFAIADSTTYEEPAITGTDVWWWEGTEDVVIAYPNDGRYGELNTGDAFDLMRQDFYAVDAAIGARAGVYSNGHAVIEGVAIAAWAVRAESAIIAVSASAPAAAEALRTAIDEAEEAGYIGAEATETGRPLGIEVRELSGGFVVGEETVLLRALEDRRAQPDQRPAYPTRSGLWGAPTVVNNVKTLATVPWIVSHGAGAYASLGDAENPGTTLVQLGGAVRKPGIVEVPLAATIREILDGPGGFVQGSLKAVLVGGPTGGFLPPDALDTTLAYDALGEAGALAGSGTLLALDESACVVDVATLMTRYLSDEACGKTIPCRIGTRRMAELGGAFCSGRARPTDAALLEELSRDVRDAALCGLEANASNSLLSGMRYFAPEFEDHIVRGHCPAGVCQPISLAGAAR